MRPSSKKPSKVSVHSLARAATQLKTTVEFNLEPFTKDPKFEKSLDEIIELFKKIDSEKEKAEFLQEFHKSAKTLAGLTEKLKHYQELVAKHEASLQEKVLSKRGSLKAPDADDQSFEDDKKKMEEAIKAIQYLLETTKQKLKGVSEKAEVALVLEKRLQLEVEKFGVLDAFKDCDKEVKKLGDKFEVACQLVAALSGKGIALPPASKAGIKVFLPGFRASLKRSSDLLDTTEHNLKGLLQDLVVDAPVIAAAMGGAGAGASGGDPSAALDNRKIWVSTAMVS